MCLYLMKTFLKKFHIGKNWLVLGLDLDPELDPDPHSSKSLDPDPHIMNVDPKHCFRWASSEKSAKFGL
jgi:hypothetical protein